MLPYFSFFFSVDSFSQILPSYCLYLQMHFISSLLPSITVCLSRCVQTWATRTSTSMKPPSATSLLLGPCWGKEPTSTKCVHVYFARAINAKCAWHHLWEGCPVLQPLGQSGSFWETWDSPVISLEGVADDVYSMNPAIHVSCDISLVLALALALALALEILALVRVAFWKLVRRGRGFGYILVLAIKYLRSRILLA